MASLEDIYGDQRGAENVRKSGALNAKSPANYAAGLSCRWPSVESGGLGSLTTHCQLTTSI
jgi:hypothetical protein